MLHLFRLPRSTIGLKFTLKDTIETVLSCPILSYPVLSCPVLSYVILSCPMLSCPVLCYPVLSCPVLSYPILEKSYPILSYHISLVRKVANFIEKWRQSYHKEISRRSAGGSALISCSLYRNDYIITYQELYTEI